jgi:demethylmenaquinone methyltransferase/2-methoxy-6-polyprenyl-1,4-benzoquinol methylase
VVIDDLGELGARDARGDLLDIEQVLPDQLDRRVDLEFAVDSHGLSIAPKATRRKLPPLPERRGPGTMNSMTGTGAGRAAPPEREVEAMFDNIVRRYDVVNSVLSMGLDRWWRRAVVAAVGPNPRQRVLDLGCGTGDLGIALARAGARVTGIDLSRGMLLEAQRKAGSRLALVRGSAFRLPFRDGAFGAAASGFVLRNLSDLGGAFTELARVVEPGGRIGLVDITEPPSRLLRRLFDAYFETVAPAIGSLVGKREAYRYLVRSLGQLPPPGEVRAMLERVGFEAAVARPLTGGMVTLFAARRART